MRSEKWDVEGAVPYKWELRCPEQIKYSELAQLAEHLTVNQVVAGSSPAFGAKTKRHELSSCLFVLLFPMLDSIPVPTDNSRMLSKLS